ncbi:MAG: tRNA (N6-isopentenyl adenosine(37)-C2)-methylthiotransferase MiaB [Gemmatimonadetes bacterium]|uniref:tRNA-2-methylthio-N(6)-dimethylallyladenosine synthase n=1 Tax=Candidatus Kutchimonas denitrificans TaxID=3056748 RepID=A0AAE5CBH1_9BACT|nr:tRNA (N6-isopentenyl adenosine(37)-C2)-methylthiotransferase MiaB [Gemmatimonadota bacterium]NIR74568.1 tRNA (N6-isopentenyl adenosine(37)-C2)-methylthiotransferase MiaB [Candidatus Kutchimonas denitrificans]NIS02758.1 tRNA (N6-isopentenyl adenosine(37)-C2)-methylthiotransferase MiaB [Gemmatimonadota bacterium]NIT68919.1 tRNA (N6-isopentenyl adenosine(37)-C2)-methylthiotransferase MiaB [Gemmatimonadota bacterium]NIU52224.1 tRNA (N6-isopentenyl adenosine(37)-C2)-methylthiotransferase MiaB [Ge
MRKKLWVETYGCQMNVADSELMEGVLAANGYDQVEAPEQADVILVNTCAIREHAEQRVLGRVAELNRVKQSRPETVIGVCGCMAQRLGERLIERAQYVDMVIGPDAYRSLPQLIEQAAQSDGGVVDVDLRPSENYEGLETRRQSRVSAWIPIQRGCNYRCTFCIVPYTRGDEKNREPGAVLEEVERLAGQGITEFTLLGQTVNSYRHGDWDFPRLLRAVARLPGVRRVRFTSPHPNDLTPELVETMAEEPAVCPQLHLPVQSGSNAVLKRMVRRYTREEYLEKVELLRRRIPEIALTTDIIVGFPGEDEDDFEATLDLVRQVRYDDTFTFRYSPREGTPSTRMNGDLIVEQEVAQERLERLIELVRRIAAEKNVAEVGRTVEVLVEKPAKRGDLMQARTETNKVVLISGPEDWIGRYLKVALTGTTGATFTGFPIEP